MAKKTSTELVQSFLLRCEEAASHDDGADSTVFSEAMQEIKLQLFVAAEERRNNLKHWICVSEYELTHPPGEWAETPKKKRKKKYRLRAKEWKILRALVIDILGTACLKCGFNAGEKIHVDHIKPKSKFPELAMEIDNLQVLCRRCNFEKAASDTTDYRQAKE